MTRVMKDPKEINQSQKEKVDREYNRDNIATSTP